MGMELELVDPDLRADMKRAAAARPDTRLGRAIIRTATRVMPSARAEGVTIDVVAAEGARVRVHRPDAQTDGGALLWIHGGGLLIGNAKLDDRICGETARDLGIVVVSVDYRLAPEHPFP